MLGPQRMQRLARQLAGPFLVGRHKKNPEQFYARGFTKSLPKCGLLVGRCGVSGDGVTARPSPSRRLISNAPARKQLRLGIPRPFVEAGDLAESSIFVPLGGSSTREPESRVFWLEARSKDSGVQWVREAVAHVGRTLVFDVHVELAGVRQQKVHDGF